MSVIMCYDTLFETSLNLHVYESILSVYLIVWTSEHDFDQAIYEKRQSKVSGEIKPSERLPHTWILLVRALTSLEKTWPQNSVNKKYESVYKHEQEWTVQLKDSFRNTDLFTNYDPRNKTEHKRT